MLEVSLLSRALCWTGLRPISILVKEIGQYLYLYSHDASIFLWKIPRNRCVQIVWSQGAITAPACADLTSKMKEGIMAAFDSAVMQRSEEVKRSESQRQMPGWNFCTFFILKVFFSWIACFPLMRSQESLASSFVGMNLFDDALLTYSELEASFLQTQASSLSGQKTISWFGKLINPDLNDDSLPLLEVGKKPYRDLILNNTISVFDFRVYLLAKHCEVLGMSGRVGELVRKAASFLGGFGQRLKECDVGLDLNLTALRIDVRSGTSPRILCRIMDLLCGY